MLIPILLLAASMSSAATLCSETFRDERSGQIVSDEPLLRCCTEEPVWESCRSAGGTLPVEIPGSCSFVSTQQRGTLYECQIAPIISVPIPPAPIPSERPQSPPPVAPRIPTPVAPPISVPALPVFNREQIENQIFDLVNSARMEQGLGQLTLNTTLIEAARKHSAEMNTLGYFNHTSPTPGLTHPSDRYAAQVREEDRHLRPYREGLLGENIFWTSIRCDAQAAHTAFMNSPEHRANILHPSFLELGVGVELLPSGECWVTQMFLRRI